MFGLQRHAATLLPRDRVSQCRWTPHDNTTGVHIVRKTDDDGNTRARFTGLQTCGSVWHCPICARLVSLTRRAELAQAMEQASRQKLVTMLMTLTFRHSKRDRLDTTLKAMRAAKKHFTNSRAWKALKQWIVGTITAIEVTHGDNGWHPHFHVLIVLDLTGAPSSVLADFEGLEAQWLASLKKQGRNGNGAAFDIDQTGKQAGKYVAKWGHAEEMTLKHHKEGKGKSRTPWQILAASRAGEPKMGRTFQEYAIAFKGTRQLTWSKGLRDRLAVPETEDKAAAEAAVTDDDDGTSDTFDTTAQTNSEERLVWLLRADWKEARRRGRGRLLTAAETPGTAAAIAAIQTTIDDKPLKPGDDQ